MFPAEMLEGILQLCRGPGTSGIVAADMSDLQKHKASDVSVDGAINIDGKGVNGFMLDWYQSTPRDVAVKSQRQVLSEFFTSMLILSANFKYKPVVGVNYYLYFIEQDWALSLIPPDRWSQSRRDGFAGRCVMQTDMTWTIAPADKVGEEGPVAEAIRRFYEAFANTLDTDLTLEEILPFYVGRMPYYQRLYASAMSRSLQRTVAMSDHNAQTCQDWRLLLPGVDRLLQSQQTG